MTDTETPVDAPAVRRPSRWRTLAVALLTLVGAILTPITIVTLFAKAELTDSSRYVQTVKPLASDPALQTYVADTVTDRLFAQLHDRVGDVNTFITELFPEKVQAKAQSIAGAVSSALRGFTNQAVLKALQSDQFQKAWVTANKAAHEQLVFLLTGQKKGVFTVNNGEMSIDLQAIGQEVKNQLAQREVNLFASIPIDKVTGQITIFKSEDLYKARRATNLLIKIGYVLPVLVFACFGGAIALARNRRRQFIAAAIAFTLGAAVLGLALRVGRGFYLGAATDALNQSVDATTRHAAAASVYDTMIRFLQDMVRNVLVFSIVVVLVAFFAGPARLAVWFRTSVDNAVAWLGRESDEAGWGWLGASAFIMRSKAVLRILVGVLGVATIILWNHPTPAVIFWIAVAALGLLAAIEFFGREPRAATGAPAAVA